MENSNVVQNDTPYEPDQEEVDSNLYFDVELEDVYCETPAGIFGLGVYAELRNIASVVADSCYGVKNSYSVKWIGVAITEQIERIAAEGTPDLTTRTLEDIFKDGMRRAEANSELIHNAVHESASKHDIPHVSEKPSE